MRSAPCPRDTGRSRCRHVQGAPGPAAPRRSRSAGRRRPYPSSCCLSGSEAVLVEVLHRPCRQAEPLVLARDKVLHDLVGVRGRDVCRECRVDLDEFRGVCVRGRVAAGLDDTADVGDTALRDPDPAPDQIGDRGDVELCRAAGAERGTGPVFLFSAPPRFSIAILALVQLMSVQMTTPGMLAAPWVPGSFDGAGAAADVRRVEHARLILIDPEPAALDPVQVRIREPLRVKRAGSRPDESQGRCPSCP